MDKVVPFLTQCTCTHARTHTHHNTEMHVCTLKAKFHYTIDSNEKQEAELSQRDRATLYVSCISFTLYANLLQKRETLKSL